MNKIYVPVGVAGTGKSTYIKENFPNAEVFSLDDYRLKLYGKLDDGNFTTDEKTHLLKTIKTDIKNALVGQNDKTIVYDATNLSRKRRAYFYSEFHKYGEIEILYFFNPKSVILDQNSKRPTEKIVPNFVIDRMYETQMPPRLGVDSDKVTIISDNWFNDVNIDNMHTVNDLKGVRPELWNELKLNFAPHDSKYHLESIDVHIARTIQNAIFDELETIARLHDLGKGIVKQFTPDHSTAHFINHEKVSANYAIAYYHQQGLSYAEMMPIIEVILEHMNALNGLSQKVINKYKLTPSEVGLLRAFAHVDQESSTPSDEI